MEHISPALTDTHCHLNFESFDNDREAVLKRAEQIGVRRILVPGIDLETSHSALDLAEQNDVIFAAVGVHPNEARSWDESSVEMLGVLLDHPKAVALGEIGLDDYWDRTPGELQRKIFEHQLEIAGKCGRPVVVHVRDQDVSRRPALNDALAILSAWEAGLRDQSNELASHPGVLHSFSGDLQAAERAAQMGFLIGITGPVTFKKAEQLKQIARELDLEKLLIETDAPFLTPHPYRGQRNEPAYVRLIAEQIAELRKVDVGFVSQITTLNAARLFLW